AQRLQRLFTFEREVTNRRAVNETGQPCGGHRSIRLTIDVSQCFFESPDCAIDHRRLIGAHLSRATTVKAPCAGRKREHASCPGASEQVIEICTDKGFIPRTHALENAATEKCRMNYESCAFAPWV